MESSSESVQRLLVVTDIFCSQDSGSLQSSCYSCKKQLYLQLVLVSSLAVTDVRKWQVASGQDPPAGLVRGPAVTVTSRILIG